MTRIMLAVLLVALACVLFVNRSETIFGADASGYANAARLLDDGEAAQPVPLACTGCAPDWFTPIGYVAVAPDRMASMYPVGLPLHLAIAGEKGQFFVSPLAALVLVFLTFRLGARLHSELAGLVAAALMAFCAVLLFQAAQPMSDVVAAMWSLAAVVAVLGGRPVLAGVCFGIAVLVRPTSMLLAPALLAGLHGLKPALRFALGGIPAAAILGWYNSEAYGTALTTGYGVGGATKEFALSYFPARFAHYAKWTAALFSPIPIVAALFVRRERLLLALWFAAFVLFYAFYFSYDEWWYTRFLLPAYPALAVAAGATFAEAVKRWRTPAIALLIVTLLWQARQCAILGVLYTDEEQHVLQVPPQWAARALPPKSIVFSKEFSGALLYYTKHRVIRWDLAPPDHALAIARATKGPVYALLMKHEEAPFLAKYGAHFRRVRTFEGGTLFESI
jgi:hypothetical protein